MRPGPFNRAIARSVSPWLSDLAGAWIFYSVLPAWPWPSPRFHRIARFASWIGLVIGALQALLCWGLLQLGWTISAAAPLVMAGVWRRVAPLWAMARVQYLRRDGTAGFHRRHGRPLWDALPSAAVLLVLAILQTPVMVLAGAPVALVVAEGLGRRLGGQTGDSYGAVLVLTEPFTLVLLALAT